MQRACHLIVQLCDLLTVIHGQGIVHRDLKPANLMLIHPGTPQETIKVMDFGLAKLAATLYIAPEEVAISSRPIVSGTPQYVCPEQVRGHDADHRGDLYTVGVLMFEMLTGHRPFGCKGVKEMLEAHEKDAPRHPRALGRLVAELDRGGSQYLDATITETLRVRPVVALVDRHVRRAVRIGGHVIPAGAMACPNIYLAQRRADLYQDPAAFRPDRFAGQPPRLSAGFPSAAASGGAWGPASPPSRCGSSCPRCCGP